MECEHITCKVELLQQSAACSENINEQTLAMVMHRQQETSISLPAVECKLSVQTNSRGRLRTAACWPGRGRAFRPLSRLSELTAGDDPTAESAPLARTSESSAAEEVVEGRTSIFQSRQAATLSRSTFALEKTSMPPATRWQPSSIASLATSSSCRHIAMHLWRRAARASSASTCLGCCVDRFLARSSSWTNFASI